MKKVRLMIIVLALGVGVVDGCSEQDQPVEKAPASSTQAAESAGKMQAEVQETASARVAEHIKDTAEEPATASSAAEEYVMKGAVAAAKDIERGKAIYIPKCTACHGVEGKGSAMAPAFKGNDWLRNADNSEIAGVIRNGRQGSEKKYSNFVIGMPTFKQMPESDVNALVDYIKSIE